MPNLNFLQLLVHEFEAGIDKTKREGNTDRQTDDAVQCVSEAPKGRPHNNLSLTDYANVRYI